MLRKLAIIGLGIGGFGLERTSLAVDEAPRKIQVSKTDQVDFKPGGILRLTNSTGTLTVEGWDQPKAEITTTKSTKRAYSGAENAKPSAELDKVRVTEQAKGDELVLVTEFPRHRPWPPGNPWGAATDFDLDYFIRVPRNTRLIISEHDVGEVHIENLSGDIDATVLQGELMLHLAEDGKYSINAKTDFGNVNCDFQGMERRRKWLTGHQWIREEPAGAQKLNLKVGYGDVVILKTQIPKAPASLLPVH